MLFRLLPQEGTNKRLLTAEEFRDGLIKEMIAYADENGIQLSPRADEFIHMLVSTRGYPESLVKCKRDDQGYLSQVRYFQPDEGFQYPIGKLAFRLETERGPINVEGMNLYDPLVWDSSNSLLPKSKAVVIDPGSQTVL